MAPRHRSRRDLQKELASLPRQDVGQFIMSLSEKEVRKLKSRPAQQEDTSEFSKLMATVALLPEDRVLAGVAALPKKQQNLFLGGMTDALELAVSQGDHAATKLVAGYREQINHIFPQTTSLKRILQQRAETLVRLGLNRLDFEQERHKSQALVGELLATWMSIRNVLQSYEDLIQSRWLKETRSRRREMLLAAWPDMPEEHRPDLARFFRAISKPEPIDMSPSIWPYINLEDLLKPKSLLIFLNSRGRHHPSNFAHSDLELSPMYKMPKEYVPGPNSP